MEIKEMRIGEDGLDIKFELNGEEIKLTKLSSIKELNKAHSYIVAIVCEEFFELTKMYAEEKGIELNEVFESQKHMDNAFNSYLAEFMDLLIKNAIIHSKANYKLFKKQREDSKNKRCDA